MDSLPALAMPDIREWTGDRSFTLGRQYVERGALSHLRQQGMTLKGRCQGTMPSPYRGEVTLGPRGIVSSVCSCSVGSGGRCKHAAVGHLTRARALYTRMGDEADWQRLIAELRERNKRLRALQDELNKAGL